MFVPESKRLFLPTDLAFHGHLIVREFFPIRGCNALVSGRTKELDAGKDLPRIRGTTGSRGKGIKTYYTPRNPCFLQHNLSRVDARHSDGTRIFTDATEKHGSR